MLAIDDWLEPPLEPPPHCPQAVEAAAATNSAAAIERKCIASPSLLLSLFCMGGWVLAFGYRDATVRPRSEEIRPLPCNLTGAPIHCS
jgi:hypothetical protein